MLAFSTSVRTGRNVPVAIARASSAAPACEIVKVFAISGREKTKPECAVSAAAHTLGLIPTIANHEGSKHGGSKARRFKAQRFKPQEYKGTSSKGTKVRRAEIQEHATLVQNTE